MQWKHYYEEDLRKLVALLTTIHRHRQTGLREEERRLP